MHFRSTTLFVLCMVFCIAGYAQTNLLQHGGFENYTAGASSYMTTGNGNATGLGGQWQLAFVGNNFPTCSGASCGTTQIDNTTQSGGSNALKLTITKHTNRNDIRLFQSLNTVPAAAKCVVTLFMKGDGNYPVTINVFKSSEAINSNGLCNVNSPCQTFAVDTHWRMFKMYVDLSSWTLTERTNMRVSIRPNTSTAVPSGPYPKTFWFDDVSFRVQDTLNELKDIAVMVATNRRCMTLDSGFTAEANTLATEIAVLRNATIALPPAPVKAIGFYPAPTQTTSAANPYINAINAWGATYLSQTFTEFPKAKSGSSIFPNSYNGRELADITMNLHWLIVSPYSNYRYNPELFRRFLSIIYATSDDYLLNGTEASTIPGSTVNALNDWFAAGEVCDGWRVGDSSFNAYIPNTFLNKMRGSADLLGSQFHTYAQAINTFLYTNRDISYAEALVNAGVYRNNSTWINMGKRIVDSMLLSTLQPDGGYLYRKYQNEVTNYHGATNNSLAKIWVLTGYQPAWDCIKKSFLFEIFSIEPAEVPEFHTAPAWKTMYNGSSGASAEPLLAITQDPFLKTRFNQFRTVSGYNYEMPLSLSFYNPNIATNPLPDNYVVYDRNIKGPRGRYGRFSYAAVGRNVTGTGQNEPGLQTIVGAMQTIPNNHGGTGDEMDAALMCVHSKVHVRKTSNQTEWTDWAYMMAAVNTKTCVGKTASTISTPGILQYQSAGPGATETNWSSYQQWITLPDRLIGFVETYPTNNTNTQAYEIDGRVRFTYGRQTSNLLNPKYMVTEVAGSRYAYGKFKAIIHAHDFTTVSVDTAGVVRDDFRNSMEIKFSYDLSNGTTLYSYPGSTKKYFMVEIKDSAATGNATVSRFISGNVKGLIVKLNGKSYASYRNDGSATTINLSSVLVSGNTNQVLFSRNDSILRLPEIITGTSYTIPANEQVLIISTNNPAADTGRGWHNCQEILDSPVAYVLSSSSKSFQAQSKDCSVYFNWGNMDIASLQACELQKGAEQSAYYKLHPVVVTAANNSNATAYDLVLPQSEEAAWYRLKMTYKDGCVKYSQSILVNNRCTKNGELSLYPNPAKSNLTVNYQHTGNNQQGNLVLLDNQGRQLLQQPVRMIRGNNTYQVNTGGISAGVYMVGIKAGSQLVQTKMLVIN